MNLRVDNLVKIFTSQGLDGFLVTDPTNVTYLTGFKPSESYLLINATQKFFITDFRYEQEAKNFLKDWNIIILNGSLFKTVAQTAKSCNITRIGFEAKSLPFAEYEKFKEELAPLIFEPTYDVIASMRMIKDKQEISLIKEAIKITLKGFDFVRRNLKAGIKEIDFAISLEYFLKQQGADGLSFSPIIASGVNSSLPHASVSKRRIQKNDIVLVDIGVSYKGYKSDLTRVFFLGKITLRFQEIYQIVTEAQKKALAAIKPGVKISDIDEISRDYILKKGWANNFRHSLGHGVGLDVHEEPAIASKNQDVLEEGMVFTVEPAIYIPGEFGVRIEDMVLVTKKGAEVLSGSRDN